MKSVFFSASLTALVATAVSAPASSAPAKPGETIVEVAASPDAKPIPEGFIGLSFEKANMATPIFDKSNASLVALLKNLGPGIARIAGATVDSHQWDPNGPGGVSKKISPPDVARLAGFLEACDWKVIYGINLADNTPEQSAAEAVAAKTLLKDRLIGYEIGNEPNLYNRDHRPKEYGYKQFLPEWNSSADAISKAVPDAIFTGPSSATYGLNSCALPMARDAKDRLAMLTTHYYIGPGKNNPDATIERMLTFPDKHLEEVLDSLREATRQNNLRLGFRLDETNSFHSGGAPGVSNTYASALWSAETLFTCAEHGAAGINFHVAGAYSPIVSEWNKAAVKEVRPEYYGIRFFAFAASGTPMRAEVKAAGDGSPLRAHAVAGKDGVLRVVLFNMNPATPCSATVAFPADIRRAGSITLTGPSLDAKEGVLLGGSPIGTDGSWQLQPTQKFTPTGRLVKVVVPPASALMIVAQP